MSAAEGSGGVRLNDVSDIAVVLLRIGFVFEGSAPAVVVRYSTTASFLWRYIEFIKRFARDFELRVLNLARVFDH